MPWARFELTIPATNRPRPTPQTARPLCPAKTELTIAILQKSVTQLESPKVVFSGGNGQIYDSSHTLNVTHSFSHKYMLL
jgi:hypothetical protein